MYLARKSHGDGVSESRSAADDDVIENERWFETIERQEPQPQSQSQLESQPEPQLEPQSPQSQLQLLSQSQLLVTTTFSTSMRETDPMQQHSNARRLQDDDNDDDDDGDKNEEEQLGDNFSMTERRAPLRVILVGWDTFRTRLLLFLIACLFVWACVFFPLLAT